MQFVQIILPPSQPGNNSAAIKLMSATGMLWFCTINAVPNRLAFTNKGNKLRLRRNPIRLRNSFIQKDFHKILKLLRSTVSTLDIIGKLRIIVIFSY